ncbi:DNA polymerase III subunit beta [Candidatus Dojkabacteria bacterium]|nr:DNA polymerase III subunit beta [Candidatus Dojkabacteria bacterium]
MKVSVLQENLSKALAHVTKAVTNKPSIPVLSNVLIEAKKGKIKLSATDLEIGINMWIGGDVIIEGSVTVSARLIAEFVGSLKPGKLNLVLEKNLFKIESEDNSAEFTIIPADEFPLVPMIEGEPLIVLNAVEFADGISQVTFATAKDDSRPVLTGVLFESTERHLGMVGVDGFRLSKRNLKLEKGPKLDFLQIIPAKALDELSNIVKDIATDKDSMEIFLLDDKNQILFVIDDVQLSTRLIEGKFPDYKTIMPKENTYKFDILKEELAATVRIAGIFARNVIGNKTRFLINPEKKKLTLTASVIDVGQNESTASLIEVEGDRLETAYNAKFLSDMLNSIKGEEIIFETNGVTAPGVFRDKDDKDFVHIIMPMRID